MHRSVYFRFWLVLLLVCVGAAAGGWFVVSNKMVLVEIRTHSGKAAQLPFYVTATCDGYDGSRTVYQGFVDADSAFGVTVPWACFWGERKMTFTTLHPTFRAWPSVQVALSFLSTDRIRVVPLSVGGWVDQLGKVSISEVDEYLSRLLNLYIPEYADSENSLDRLEQADIFAELSRLVPAAWPVSSVERAWSQGRLEQVQMDMRQKYQSLSERVDRLLHQSNPPVILSPPAPTPI